jgi:hypothetical protein
MNLSIGSPLPLDSYAHEVLIPPAFQISYVWPASLNVSHPNITREALR